ncbi:hypothetical protein [Sagittula salina]|uniref:Uncharacterized protein n=1 Tax=Sagittula salina TaxID=2820268 RepID=A0A940S407_9RHOB|nr:hypothetical protein [Sagittula salina]MBP0483604.1 hypothetical protein [Sagittula salina]
MPLPALLPVRWPARRLPCQPAFLPACLAFAALSACAIVSLAPAVRGGTDGVAAKLRPGVTRAEADVALGPDAGFERNPKDFDESCVSYAYGGVPPLYVHAVFRAGGGWSGRAMGTRRCAPTGR